MWCSPHSDGRAFRNGFPAALAQTMDALMGGLASQDGRTASREKEEQTLYRLQSVEPHCVIPARRMLSGDDGDFT